MGMGFSMDKTILHMNWEERSQIVCHKVACWLRHSAALLRMIPRIVDISMFHNQEYYIEVYTHKRWHVKALNSHIPHVSPSGAFF